MKKSALDMKLDTAFRAADFLRKNLSPQYPAQEKFSIDPFVNDEGAPAISISSDEDTLRAMTSSLGQSIDVLEGSGKIVNVPIVLKPNEFKPR
jgi:hypothetical protein